MRMILLALAALLFLAGCAGNAIQSPLDDGYQVGDLTKTPFVLQAQYCANADPQQRAVLLALLERTSLPVPDRGACTNILELVDIEDLPPVPNIDVDAAREDQKRFQEQLE